MALLDWGTYNGLKKLHIAELLGMTLTEIIPYDFTKRTSTEEYFKKYGTIAKGFKTITAHAPYYSTVSESIEKLKNSRRGLVSAAKKAEIANAQFFNLHLGGKLEDLDKTIEIASETIKAILENTEKVIVSLETTYSRYNLGSIEEIRAIMEKLNSNRVIISLQLENDWMREKEVYRTGLYHLASKETDEGFWLKLLKDALKLNNSTYLSLRFSQITGVKMRGVVVKKRVPLGMGYPDVDVLTKAIAKFLVKEIYDKGLDTKVHLIYTGLPETKYKDAIQLYSKLASEIVPLLE